MIEAGIEVGVGVILGLGGTKHSEDHVKGTIRVLNEINSPAIGVTVLNPQSDSPLYDDIQAGTFELPTYRQIFWEETELLKGLQVKGPSIFRSGFFLPNDEVIMGNLPDEKERLIKQSESRIKRYPQWLNKKVRMNGHL